MKILIAVDDSEYSRRAISAVPDLFSREATEIKILHVLTPISSSTPPQMARGYAPEMAGLKREPPFDLDHSLHKLRTAGFTVDTVVETGEVRTTIIDYASNWGADLIAVGSHGHKGLLRLLLGSVAESVVRHAPCSVLVIRHPIG